ncbi:MAG TPA: siphovirus Gp157 family protein [Gammaproteobacteria bacterium]
MKKITAPDFTLSIRPGSPSLVVMDEAVIPPEFWEPRDPRLNRQALLAELKGSGAIEGVALSNSEFVLSVRTK